MTGKFAFLRRHKRTIIIVLAVVLMPVVAYGCCIGSFTLAMNWPYIRADIVTQGVLPRVEEIARQIKAIALADSVLVMESPPQADIKHFALSEGTTQYVTISTYQIYDTTLDRAAFINAYREQFTQWGWDTLNLGDYSGRLSAVFQQQEPDDMNFLFRIKLGPRMEDNLVVGLCPSPDLATAPGMTRFVVFVDFDEYPYNLDCGLDHICMVAQSYCRAH